MSVRADDDGAIGRSVDATVAADVELVLLYPMTQHESGIWMRELMVDENTAEISTRWVCVVDDKQRVGRFKLA